MAERPEAEGVERESRRVAGDAVRRFEQFLYVAVAAALGLTGLALLVHTIIAFCSDLLDGATFFTSILALLDSLLLVFIIAELLHTVRAAVTENVLLTEPFLIVGMIASIRRLIVITAEASGAIGTPRFDDLMIELGVLAAVTLVLGVTLFMVRHTRHPEPRPSHEQSASGHAIAGDGQQTTVPTSL
jgi:uncharacterized membrane protein (DUF373 family)